MTLGSAAFLPGSAPAALLPSFGFFPPGRSPVGLAANDLPRGRILVVERQAVVALDLQRILREAGYRVVGPASTAGEVRRLVDRGAIDGAIVDLDLAPAAATAIADLLERAGIPAVLLSGAALEALPDRHRDRPLVHKPYTGAGLVTALRQALEKAGADGDIEYPISPPPISWPRVFPQL